MARELTISEVYYVALGMNRDINKGVYLGRTARNQQHRILVKVSKIQPPNDNHRLYNFTDYEWEGEDDSVLRINCPNPSQALLRSSELKYLERKLEGVA